MAPTIVMAPRHVQLENCAAWHDERADKFRRDGNSEEAERHDLIAFRLFSEAHRLRSLPYALPAA